MATVSRWLAVVFAIVLAFGEIVRNRNGWQWWPFWTVDYIAAGLLLAGAILWKNPSRPNPILTGGWGFACAIFWMSFFSHVEAISSSHQKELNERTLTVVIGIMFGITVIGFGASILDAVKRANTEGNG